MTRLDVQARPIRVASRLAALAAVGLATLTLTACAVSKSPYASPGGNPRSPLRAERLSHQAIDAMQAGNLDKAEELLRRALTHDLYYGPAHNNLGALHFERGDLYDAANEFEWARKLMPGNPEPRVNLGLTLERAGRVDDAIAHYTAALEFVPEYLPGVQALTRAEITNRRFSDTTKQRLELIQLSSTEAPWRQWAAEQHALLQDRP